jgi:phospholipid/cholesterol/gamma-HCH transport system substrate-binding protein
VSGLRVGAAVEVRGVVVGRVVAIGLEGGHRDPVTLKLEIEQGIPIPVGATAVLRMRGVTGLTYVDISGGDFLGPVREPGDTIPTRPSAISEITDQGAALVQESRQLIGKGMQVTDKLDGFLDDENREHVDRILERGERAIGHLEQAAAQVARTSAHVEQLTAGEGKQAVQAADELIGETRRLLQANRHQITAMIGDLREAARSFRRLAQSLERDPSRLLFRRRAGEKEHP